MGRRHATSASRRRPDIERRIPFWRMWLGDAHVALGTVLTARLAFDLADSFMSGSAVDVTSLQVDVLVLLALMLAWSLLVEFVGDGHARVSVVGNRLVIGAIPRLTRERVVRLDRIDVETRRWNDLPLALLGFRAIRQHGGPSRFVPWLWLSRDDLELFVAEARYLAERAPTGALAR